MGCTFCGIYEHKVSVVYENDYFFAQFDKFPITPCHSEIIPKRHAVSLLGLTETEWHSLYPALSGTIDIINCTDFRKVYTIFIESPLNEKSLELCTQMLSHVGIEKKMEGFNLGVNDGKAAGRTIDHLHIHIIPIFLGDVEDYVGGIRHMIHGMWKGFIERHPEQVLWGSDRGVSAPWDKDQDIALALNNYTRAFISRLDPAVQEKFAYKNAEKLISK